LIEIVVVIIAIAYLIPDQDSSISHPSKRALHKTITDEGGPQNDINNSEGRNIT
jgi:hypothetical protein